MTVRTIVLSKLLKIYSPGLQPQPSSVYLSIYRPEASSKIKLKHAALTQPSSSHSGLLPKPALVLSLVKGKSPIKADHFRLVKQFFDFFKFFQKIFQASQRSSAPSRKPLFPTFKSESRPSDSF